MAKYVKIHKNSGTCCCSAGIPPRGRMPSLNAWLRRMPPRPKPLKPSLPKLPTAEGNEVPVSPLDKVQLRPATWLGCRPLKASQWWCFFYFWGRWLLVTICQYVTSIVTIVNRLSCRKSMLFCFKINLTQLEPWRTFKYKKIMSHTFLSILCIFGMTGNEIRSQEMTITKVFGQHLGGLFVCRPSHVCDSAGFW